jgi:hypothetical protein
MDGAVPTGMRMDAFDAERKGLLEAMTLPYTLLTKIR